MSISFYLALVLDEFSIAFDFNGEKSGIRAASKQLSMFFFSEFLVINVYLVYFVCVLDRNVSKD